MAGIININKMTNNAVENVHEVKAGSASNGRINGNKEYDVTFDYSAIKLTEDDKRYRMDIRKQADSLLKAAESITNRFPPLFTQMITSYNSVRNDVQETSADQKQRNTGSDTKQNPDGQVNAASETAKASEAIAADRPESTQQLDVEGIYGVVSGFVNEINGLASKASESGSYTAGSTIGRIMSAAEDFGDQLSDVGISYSSDVGFQMNEDRMKEAIKNGEAEKVLTAEKGFTERISRIANEAMRHSDNFIEKTNTTNDNRPAKNTSVNYNYITNASIDN